MLHVKKHAVTSFAAMVLFGASVSQAVVVTITDDTYLDSTYSVYNGTVVANTQDTAFDTYTGTSGSSHTPSNNRVKVVSSNGSTQFPGDSKVHGLFKLPQAFWDAYDLGTMQSAIVSFTIFNNSLNTGNPPDQRDVELHPMTHDWSTTTATWRTYDGINPWSTTDTTSDHDDPGTGGGGGDYDASRFVLTTNPNAPSGGLISWNITPLFTDPVAMTELRDNGALLKETNETTFDGNRFYSMYSFNAGGSTVPVVSYSVVPEPTALVGLVGAGVLMLVRRRRHA